MKQDLRTMLVRNNKTGEVIAITLTRAGIYKLAKMSAETNGCSLIDAFTGINSLSPLSDIAPRYVYHDIYCDVKMRLFGDDAYGRYVFFDCCLQNMAMAADCKWRFKEDLIYINGRYYPRAWRKYLQKEEVGDESYFDQDLIINDDKENILRFIDDEDIGMNGVSYMNMSNRYKRCDECHQIFDTYAVNMQEVGDCVVCESCLYDSGEYYRCDYCGEWFHRDSDDAQFAGDNCYCSCDCAENDGWRWSDRYDEWVTEDDYYEEEEHNEVDEIVCEYHSHCYVPKGERKATQKNDLYNGYELEIDGKDRYDFSYDYYVELNNMLGKNCFFETDGSLDSGFEIISHPLTEKEFDMFDWKKTFDKLIEDGWRSHDTSTCGLHFHFSEGYLGYTENQIKDSAKKICRLFQLYADDFSKIARRDYNSYTMNMRNFEEDISSKTSFRKLRETRYWAVNLTNLFRGTKSTIEIRVCRGTLKTSTFLASHDLFLHIVRNAKRIAWKDIDNLSLWFKGIKNKNTIDYIKERNAFVGAF